MYFEMFVLIDIKVLSILKYPKNSSIIAKISNQLSVIINNHCNNLSFLFLSLLNDYLNCLQCSAVRKC